MKLFYVVLLAIVVAVECMPKPESDVEVLSINEKTPEGLNSTNIVDQKVSEDDSTGQATVVEDKEKKTASSSNDKDSAQDTVAGQNKAIQESNSTSLVNETPVSKQTYANGSTVELSTDNNSTNNDIKSLEEAENKFLTLEAGNESNSKDNATLDEISTANNDSEKQNKEKSNVKLGDKIVTNSTSELENNSGNQFDSNNSSRKNHEEKSDKEEKTKDDKGAIGDNINEEINEDTLNTVGINDGTKQNKNNQTNVEIKRETQNKQEQKTEDQMNHDINRQSTGNQNNKTIASKDQEEIINNQTGVQTGVEENKKTGTRAISKVKDKKKSESDRNPKLFDAHKINFHKDVLRMLDREEILLGLKKDVQSSSIESIEESYKASELAKLRKDYLLSLAQSIHNAKIVADEYGHPRVVSPHHQPGAKTLRAALRYGYSPISSHYANVQFVDEKFGNLPSLFGPGAKLDKLDIENKGKSSENMLYDAGRSRHAIRSLFDTNIRNKYDISNSAANLQLSPYEWRERFRKQSKVKAGQKSNIESPVKGRGQVFKLDKIDPIVRDAIFSRSVKDILKTSQNKENIDPTSYSKEKGKIKTEQENEIISGENEENLGVSKSNVNDITINNHLEALTYANGRNEFLKPIIAQKPHFEVSKTAYDASKDLFSQMKTNTLNFAQNVFDPRMDSGNIMKNMLDNSKYTIQGSTFDINDESRDIVFNPFDKTSIFVNSDENKVANNSDLEITTAASNFSKAQREDLKFENITDSIINSQGNSSHIKENVVVTDSDTNAFQNLNNTTKNDQESLDTSSPTTVTEANRDINKSTSVADESNSKNVLIGQDIENKTSDAISTNFTSKSDTIIDKSVIDTETSTNLTSEVVTKVEPENNYDKKDDKLTTTVSEDITNKTTDFNTESNLSSQKNEIKSTEATNSTVDSTSNIEVTTKTNDTLDKIISPTNQTVTESKEKNKELNNYKIDLTTTSTKGNNETQINDTLNVEESSVIPHNISDTRYSINDSIQVETKNTNEIKSVNNLSSSIIKETDNATDLTVLAIGSNKTEVTSLNKNSTEKPISTTSSILNETLNDDTENNSNNINSTLNDLSKKTVLEVTTNVYDSSLDSILVNVTEKPKNTNETSANGNSGDEADNFEKLSARSVPDSDEAFNLDNIDNTTNKTDDFNSRTSNIIDTTTTISTETIMPKYNATPTGIVENDANKIDDKSKSNVVGENNQTLTSNEHKETLNVTENTTDRLVKDESNNITDSTLNSDSNQIQNSIETSIDTADTKDLTTTTASINSNNTSVDLKLDATSPSNILADLNNTKTTVKEAKNPEISISEVKVDSDDAVKTNAKRELNLSEEPVPSISEANEAGSSDNTTITGTDTTITTNITSENKTSANRLGDQDQTTEFITVIKTETPSSTIKAELPTTTIASEKPPEIIIEKPQTIRTETQPTSIDTFLKTVKSDREKEESKNEIDSSSKSDENTSKSVSVEGVIYANLDSINLEDSASSSLEALRR